MKTKPQETEVESVGQVKDLDLERIRNDYVNSLKIEEFRQEQYIDGIKTGYKMLINYMLSEKDKISLHKKMLNLIKITRR